MNLIDTSILVDYLRQFPPAVEYLDGLAEQDKATPAMSLVSALELYHGAQSSASLEIVGRFLESFRILDLTKSIGQQSLKVMKRYKLATGVDVPDSLIAATALANRIPLATRNLKHFKPIEGLHVTAPY